MTFLNFILELSLLKERSAIIKFWNEENKDGIIGNYKKDENSIIISYLDGTTEKILLSRENEQKILDLMLY